jgi:membrane protease YdiL (CAAX protease family)
MFGFFHLSLYRILPTGVLGVVLTLACLRSGSIFVPMIMHFLNNALLMVASSEEVGLLEGEAGPPLWWMVAGTGLVVGAVALMGRTGPIRDRA